jgi:hypothetical protein
MTVAPSANPKGAIQVIEALPTCAGIEGRWSPATTGIWPALFARGLLALGEGNEV